MFNSDIYGYKVSIQKNRFDTLGFDMITVML